jgi:hypothetical protein
MTMPTSYANSPSMEMMNQEFNPAGSNLMDGLNNMSNNYDDPEIYHNR